MSTKPNPHWGLKGGVKTGELGGIKVHDHCRMGSSQQGGVAGLPRFVTPSMSGSP